MSSWRAGFRRLGGPDAVSWPLFWVTFASNLIGHFVTPGQTDATPAVRVLAVVCSQVALFIPLLLARATVLSDPARPHPWLAVTAFVAAIFTRTAALAWVPEAASLGANVYYTLLLLGMTLTIQLFIYPDAWPTHIQWLAFMIVIVLRGPGAWSLDALIGPRLLGRAEPAAA